MTISNKRKRISKRITYTKDGFTTYYIAGQTITFRNYPIFDNPYNKTINDKMLKLQQEQLLELAKYKYDYQQQKKEII